jgi:hypothetical protein
MILAGYQIGVKPSLAPTSNWILALGAWSDSGEWIDTETLID